RDPFAIGRPRQRPRDPIWSGLLALLATSQIEDHQSPRDIGLRARGCAAAQIGYLATARRPRRMSVVSGCSRKLFSYSGLDGHLPDASEEADRESLAIQ